MLNDHAARGLGRGRAADKDSGKEFLRAFHTLTGLVRDNQGEVDFPCGLAADQTGTFVLVVDENQTVATRYIEIGQQRDGVAVVKEGLKEGDLVIVQGMQRVRNGMKVNPQQSEPRS